MVLVEAQRLEGLVGEATGELAGELRISILSTLAPYLIPLTIAPFARRYPGVELVFEEMFADKAVDNVRRDVLAQASSRPRRPRAASWRCRAWAVLVGYVARGHRLVKRDEIGAEDLSPDEVWTVAKDHCYREQVLALVSRGATPRADARPAPTRGRSSSRAATSRRSSASSTVATA